MSEKRYILKITILGDYAVGKTSLLNGYIEKKFDFDYKPTLGANIKKIEFKLRNKTASVNIWDIAGQVMFKTMHGAFFEGSNGVIIVYDVSRPETFDHLSNWYTDFKKHVKNEVPGVIVGNKIDLEKLVDTKKAETFAKSIGYYFVESSALKKERVADAFEKILNEILPKD